MYLEVSDVKKSYGEGGSYIQVLKGVSLQVKQGGWNRDCRYESR